MNNLFDAAICLCLDRRKEHWKELQTQVESKGIEFIPFIAGSGNDSELVYNHVDDPNPDVSRWQYGVPHLKHHHYNAMVCHKKMIELVKEKGYKKVLFLEDDAYFTERYDDVLSRLDYNYQNMIDEADLVFLGWWHNPDDHPFNINVENGWKKNKDVRLEVINPYKRIGGLHGVVIKEQVYDYILSLPFINPIDSQLCDASDKFSTVLVIPKIIHVKTMYSETEGAVFERTKL